MGDKSPKNKEKKKKKQVDKQSKKKEKRSVVSDALSAERSSVSKKEERK